jgi:hypothetical protein
LIGDLLKRAMAETAALDLEAGSCKDPAKILPAAPLGTGIPTLRAGVYQPFTPQPKERYELFGRWEKATHGHWLGLNDMEALWKTHIEDSFLADIQSQRLAVEGGWPHQAANLFGPERLSLFACCDVTREKIYLLWLICKDEPELWVYDSNGESRYKDLKDYLDAYLADDIRASERRWRL